MSNPVGQLYGNFSVQAAPLNIGGQKIGGFSLNFQVPDIQNLISESNRTFAENSARNYGFVHQQINQSEQFSIQQTVPILNATKSLINQISGQLPAFFSTTSDVVYKQLAITQELNANVIATNKQIALASIRAQESIANSVAKSSGGCFITTAVCEFYGKDDDCVELEMLRKFRDDFMLTDPGYAELVKRYYATAPGIVEKIKLLDADKQRHVWNVVHGYVTFCLFLMVNGEPHKVVDIYRDMLDYCEVMADGY